MHSPIVEPDSRAREAYNSWHAGLPIDGKNATPWHGIVRSYLPLESLKGSLILEIGCGRGDFSCWLAKQLNGSAQQIAADFSVTAVSKGRKYALSEGFEV